MLFIPKNHPEQDGCTPKMKPGRKRPKKILKAGGCLPPGTRLHNQRPSAGLLPILPFQKEIPRFQRAEICQRHIPRRFRVHPQGLLPCEQSHRIKPYSLLRHAESGLHHPLRQSTESIRFNMCGAGKYQPSLRRGRQALPQGFQQSHRIGFQPRPQKLISDGCRPEKRTGQAGI